MSFTEGRLWQTFFEVHCPLGDFAMPDCVVEEEQDSPRYLLQGKSRAFERGGQLSITLSGQGMVQTGDVIMPLFSGQAFLHNHNDPLVNYFYPADGKEPWRFLWAAFEGRGAEELIRSVNRQYGYLFRPGVDSELVKLLRSYHAYNGEVLVMPPLEAASWVHKVLTLLCEKKENTLLASSHSNMVAEIQQGISRSPGENWKIADLAARYKISREHLSRVFKEQTSMTLRDYILEERLKVAVSMLRHTYLSVKEISDRCGWKEYAIFYRLFQSRVGCSPMDFRKRGDGGEEKVALKKGVGEKINLFIKKQ